MRAVQTVYGKFHHFHLARQLYKRGVLEKIFSSYPWYILRDEGIPRQKVGTFPWIHAPIIAKWKLGWRNKYLDRELTWWLANTLDSYVAKNLPECEVFIGISGSSVKTGKLVKSRGGRYICDRASSHVRFADRILGEEFSRWGQEFEGVDPRHIHREETEYERADVITVPSEFARSSFLEMGVDEVKLRKIPYGVDLTRYSKIAEPPGDVFRVLFVGQVSFRKGVPYLLDAFSRLNHPGKQLTIVGAVQPEMKKFLQGKQLEGVEFGGTVPEGSLKEIMSRSHVMVLPSIEEGLALVQAGAMACGCPLISSRHTGAEDLFNDGQEGFIVPIRDPAAIADRLDQLAADRDLRDRMGEAALQRAKGLGGWDTYGSDYFDLLQGLTG